MGIITADSYEKEEPKEEKKKDWPRVAGVRFGIIIPTRISLQYACKIPVMRDRMKKDNKGSWFGTKCHYYFGNDITGETMAELRMKIIEMLMETGIRGQTIKEDLKESLTEIKGREPMLEEVVQWVKTWREEEAENFVQEEDAPPI